jgi:HME family heavy-metal exporter
MLNALIRYSLRHRPLVLALSLVALGYGGYAAVGLPIDVFPDLDRPRVTLMTECPGLAPEEVETLVTAPVESALLGANGVQQVRSQSGFGLSSVVVEFGWGTDVRTARQVVQERIATVAADLPPDVRPQMTPVSSILGQILIAGLRRQPGPTGGELTPVPGTAFVAERVPAGDGEPKLLAWRPTDRRTPAAWQPVAVAGVRWQPAEADGGRTVTATVGGATAEVRFPSALQQQLALRTLADWVVRPRLLKVGGVAQVVTMGGGRKQYQVLVDPVAMAEYGVTLGEVEAAVRANNTNTSGGYAVRGGLERPVRVIGRLGPRPELVAAELLKVPVRAGGPRPVLLEQVARVAEGPQPVRGDAGINGGGGVALTVTKQPFTDTRAVTDSVVAALRTVEPMLPADVRVETELYQLREFIDRGVANVGEALAVGAVLVLVVLFAFLLNVRTTFISLTAIPLSLAVTVIAFRLIGAATGVELSINVMTLGGIAVALGELVDDAIVDVENIFRRLRENRHSPNPRPALRVVYEASAEVRTAIVFGTAVVVLVFLPLFALSGMEGQLFTPLGIAYIVSILASLLVSLTVTPVLSYYLLANARATHREEDGWLVRLLKWAAGYLVRFSLRRAGLLLVLTWVLVGYAGWRLSRLGGDFLPAFDEGAAQLSVTLPPGTSLEASAETGRLIDAALADLTATPDRPDAPLRSFVRKTGRAELDEHADPPSASDIVIQLNPHAGRPREEALDAIRKEVLERVPGIDAEIEQPLAHLISENISGSTAQIAVKVFGDDLDVLRATAERVQAAAAKVPGVATAAVEPVRTVDEIHIRPRPDDLAVYGVSRAAVGEFVHTALNGAVVSQVVEGPRRFDLVVRLDEPHRSDVANLQDLRFDLPDGHGSVRLGDLADVTPPTGGDAGANQVKRENGRRRLVVRINTAGRDLVGVAAAVRRAVEAKVGVPEGYAIEYAGQFENQRAATVRIAGLAAVAAVGMFFVLYLLFPSARVVIQILHAIPVAFVGGVIALAATGQTLSVAALVGFISLGGIAVRNGILLVTHYVHLMGREGEGFSAVMIVRGSLERLPPVLMTALTAGLGLVPLVVAGRQPGREILYPVATVILGGLVTSTFCEFLLHPGLFWRFSGRSVGILTADAAADGLDAPARSPSEEAH